MSFLPKPPTGRHGPWRSTVRAARGPRSPRSRVCVLWQGAPLRWQTLWLCDHEHGGARAAPAVRADCAGSEARGGGPGLLSSCTEAPPPRFQTWMSVLPTRVRTAGPARTASTASAASARMALGDPPVRQVRGTHLSLGPAGCRTVGGGQPGGGPGQVCPRGLGTRCGPPRAVREHRRPPGPWCSDQVRPWDRPAPGSR